MKAITLHHAPATYGTPYCFLWLHPASLGEFNIYIDSPQKDQVPDLRISLSWFSGGFPLPTQTSAVERPVVSLGRQLSRTKPCNMATRRKQAHVPHPPHLFLKLNWVYVAILSIALSRKVASATWVLLALAKIYDNLELGLCIKFGPVRKDSVRQGGASPPLIIPPHAPFGSHPSTFDAVMDFYQGYLWLPVTFRSPPPLSSVFAVPGVLIFQGWWTNSWKQQC